MWPESLWAPISFTRTYLKNKGFDENEWKKYWCDKDAEVYQFMGEDNLYFYGLAQQAMWLYMQGLNPNLNPENGCLRTTKLVPIKTLLCLFLGFSFIFTKIRVKLKGGETVEEKEKKVTTFNFT